MADGAHEPVPSWWRRPRAVSVVVDNPSWILPYAERLVADVCEGDDRAVLCRTHDEVVEGGIAFYLGCVRIARPEILSRNHRNLVVHESDLPRGRGFAPVAWQILEGRNDIPVCLFEAQADADSGPVIYRDAMRLSGDELMDEIRAAQGEKTVELCRRFLDAPAPPAGEPQAGDATFYPRRRPADSRLDANRTIADQFELLRTVDNERYPAFFTHRGCEYVLYVERRPRLTGKDLERS